jgi:hypothetical protein
MTAFQAITKSTTEHLGAAQFNRPPLPAKRHGFSPPFTNEQTNDRVHRVAAGGSSKNRKPTGRNSGATLCQATFRKQQS